jgi:hypothetical protein
MTEREPNNRRLGYARVSTYGQMRIPTIAAIDSDRSQPSVPNEASRAFR